MVVFFFIILLALIFASDLLFKDISCLSFVCKNKIVTVSICIICFIVLTCFTDNDTSPLNKIIQDHKHTLNFSAVLTDQKEINGQFFQKFSVIKVHSGRKAPQVHTQEWMEASKKEFDALLPFLGMTVLTKIHGTVKYAANPPGYEYVDNSGFGHWDHLHLANNWVWYPEYAIWSKTFATEPYTRKSYEAYLDKKRRHQPYFGQQNQFGTRGIAAKKQHPSFYCRHNAAKLIANASHFHPTHNRIGRSSVHLRSRSGGFGK